MSDILTVPPGATESEASYFWLDEDGILCILNKPRDLHDTEDALQNVIITQDFTKDSSRLLLIDMTNIRSMSRGAREAYAQEGSRGRVKAVALVTKSMVSRIVANFFIGFNRPGAPTKLFNDNLAAKKWLIQYL
jgi:hypothetical protein